MIDEVAVLGRLSRDQIQPVINLHGARDSFWADCRQRGTVDDPSTKSCDRLASRNRLRRKRTHALATCVARLRLRRQPVEIHPLPFA